MANDHKFCIIQDHWFLEFNNSMIIYAYCLYSDGFLWFKSVSSWVYFIWNASEGGWFFLPSHCKRSNRPRQLSVNGCLSLHFNTKSKLITVTLHNLWANDRLNLQCSPGFPIPSGLKRSGKTICSSLNGIFGARLQLVIEGRDTYINTVHLSSGGRK